MLYVEASALQLLAGLEAGPPSPAMLAAARERAAVRAREMVPPAALLQSYLIAQRVISAAIAAMADAYVR
jgi:hypothetical protein